MTGGKSQDRDVESRDGRKGNRRAEAITERLAAFLFDGLYPSQFWCRTYLDWTAASIKAGVGSRMGLPPGAKRIVTCLTHTIDVASQVSTRT